MAAGATQLPIKDSAGTSRNARQWSSDGSLAGDLQPMIYAADGDQVTIGAKADAAYADAAGAAAGTLVALLKGAFVALKNLVLAAGENHIGAVGGHSAVVGVTVTRPADTTAYAIGDLVAASTTAATVNGSPSAIAAARVNAGSGVITRCRLSTNKTGLVGTEVFRIHLFKTAPTVANGDNGAFSVNGVAAVYLGAFDVTLDRVFSDGAKGFALPLVGSSITFDAAAGTTSIFALIEARNAYTPASGETFTIALEVQRD